MSGRQWQRLGALTGFLFVALTFATIFAPSEPDADEPISTIAQAISEDRTAHVFFTYIGEIGAVVFLVFVAALWSMLRRAEPEAGASMVALMGGLGFSVIEIGRHGAFLALVEAADKGREPPRSALSSSSTTPSSPGASSCWWRSTRASRCRSFLSAACPLGSAGGRPRSHCSSRSRF